MAPPVAKLLQSRVRLAGEVAVTDTQVAVSGPASMVTMVEAAPEDLSRSSGRRRRFESFSDRAWWPGATGAAGAADAAVDPGAIDTDLADPFVEPLRSIRIVVVATALGGGGEADLAVGTGAGWTEGGLRPAGHVPPLAYRTVTVDRGAGAFGRAGDIRKAAAVGRAGGTASGPVPRILAGAGKSPGVAAGFWGAGAGRTHFSFDLGRLVELCGRLVHYFTVSFATESRVERRCI